MVVEEDGTDESTARMLWPDVPRLAFAPGQFGEDLDADLAWAQRGRSPAHSLHALPHLGRMRMDEVKPRHLRDLVLALKNEGKLAPRTIRQVSGLLHRCSRAQQSKK
jgi:hypothetical protein